MQSELQTALFQAFDTLNPVSYTH
ncbi:hypothetical protein ABHC15_16960, partial [Escherichia coli]